MATADEVRSRRRSAEDTLADALTRVEAVDGRVGAFLEVTPDLAFQEARAADALLLRAAERHRDGLAPVARGEALGGLALVHGAGHGRRAT